MKHIFSFKRTRKVLLTLLIFVAGSWVSIEEGIAAVGTPKIDPANAVSTALPAIPAVNSAATEGGLPSAQQPGAVTRQSLMITEAARAAIEFHERVAQLPKSLPAKRREAKAN